MEIAALNLRAELSKLSENDFTKISDQIVYSALIETREIFGVGIEIDVLIEQGSIVARLKFIGKVAAVMVPAAYGGIASYPSFEEGLALAQTRAEQLTNVISEKIARTVKPANGVVVKSQASYGDIEKINEASMILRDAQKTVDRGEREILIQKAILVLFQLRRSNDPDDLDILLKQLPAGDLPIPKTADELIAIEQRRRRETKGRQSIHSRQMELPGVSLEEAPRFSLEREFDEKLRFHKRVTT